MATILDVAKLAGVSQGTVSNVLNGKGNVSSEKIRIVEEAARTLGYTINEQARMLRRGTGNTIGIILPTVESRQYREFYNSLKYYAESRGYSVELFISNNSPQTEMEMIQKARSARVCGVAAITCLSGKDNPYQDAELKRVCFVERRPAFQADYYGFDYRLAGSQMAKRVLKKGYRNVAVITETEKYSNEAEFLKGFNSEIDENCGCSVLKITTDLGRISHSILNLFAADERIDAIVTTNIGLAESIRQIAQSLFGSKKMDIHTLSPVISLPEKDFIKYELNYSLLGKKVASRILEQSEGTGDREVILDNDGERDWKHISITAKPAECLRVLALDGPESVIVQGMSQLYTEKTGTKIKVAVYSYDEIYDQFVSSEISDLYDVFRIDVRWLSWFAERLLLPLEQIDPDIRTSLSEYLPALEDKYCYVRGKIYALPTSPSAQLLFYRKDLFENAAIKRQYREKYKKELQIPETFEEYNRIAAFFTEGDGFGTDVRYGTNLTLGNTGVAATEFLARFFGHKKNLYNENGKIVINNDVGKKAMEELLELQKYIPGKPAKWWTTAAKEFAGGNIAMMINFSNYASEILGYHSKIIGNVGFGMVPGGNPIYGGGSLAVSKNSRHPEDALAFIKWITREPVASGMAALGNVSPCIRTYDKYDIMKTFPWLELSKKCFLMSETRRLPDEDGRPFDEKKFMNIVGSAVKNVMTGLLGTDEALARAQSMIDEEMW
ncbi:ABC transporter, solute-binding protein [Marvinbryantia formatexigens DSM 14469]|uniref:ABC transporter, solute-binding protein n=1 Tax=Marvinbryantia formatexigens DSM 14469 TaxID=478749 RepID=C6LAI3_9FIRM|nr:extracellular solute-binding protein [Marvinbryantia formatexigens]EET62590.1 ABC transporter, solute-binding protein [Marvinbryantia formatexigens DSM 14469]UWO23254.1 extracellular solute-binding protein [Marvinbryantia formatexigens DSM 14469]SDG61178.1 multiple sugar transport system substrate-binding protein [Marvinbryantia formatexigens]